MRRECLRNSILGGFFITFEGDDGVGKSTHVHLLAETLSNIGFDVLCLREPGNTSIGEKLRDVLLDSGNSEMVPECELLIYEAARSQMVREVLIPALQADKVVICDRFTDSTLAYQAAGRGLSAEFVEAANNFATGGLQPDLTILMELPDTSEKVRRIEKRGASDRLELAGADFHNRVSNAFANMPGAHMQRIVRVVTEDDEEETAKRVIELVCARMGIEATHDASAASNIGDGCERGARG